MTGYVRCACCNLPIPVTADDVGLTVTCPRTKKLIAVRATDLKPTAAPPGKGSPSAASSKTPDKGSPPPATSKAPPPGAMKHPSTRSVPPPPAKRSPTPSPAKAATPAHRTKPAEPVRGRSRLPIVVALVCGLVAVAAGGYFAVKAFRPELQQKQEADTANRAEPKPVESGSSSSPVVTTPPVRPVVPMPVVQTPVGPAPVAPTPVAPAPTLVTPPIAPPQTVTPPAPARPLSPSLNELTATYRQEVVRVNHPRNCILCHAPSIQQTDLVRGAVPDPRQSLPPPNTPVYYERGGQFVTADTTYLKQDFSLVQPVPDPGNWSSHQRYDYFVAIRKVEGEPVTTPAAESPYHQAVRFALRELSGRDPDRDSTWMAEQQRLAGLSVENHLAGVAQAASLKANPAALLALKSREFSIPLIRTPSEDLAKFVKELQEKYGEVAARSALIAYLQPLTQVGDEAARAKAVCFLSVALSDTADADCPANFPLAAAPRRLLHRPPRQFVRRGPPSAAAKTDPGLEGTGKDARGFTIYSIAKRIDKRTLEDLEKGPPRDP